MLCIVHTFPPSTLYLNFFEVRQYLLLFYWNTEVRSTLEYTYTRLHITHISVENIYSHSGCVWLNYTSVSVQFSILPWWLHMWLIWAYVFSLFMDSRVKELFSCADAHLTCYLRLPSLKWNVRHPKTLFSDLLNKINTVLLAGRAFCFQCQNKDKDHGTNLAHQAEI